MATAYALARGDRLAGFAEALDSSYWRRSNIVAVVLAALLAATVVAAIHVALGLVFDPRYKDFPFAALAGPVDCARSPRLHDRARADQARRSRDRGGDGAGRLGALRYRQ